MNKEYALDTDIQPAHIGATLSLLRRTSVSLRVCAVAANTLRFLVSPLQRRFSTGYARASALVEAHALDTRWCIGFILDDQRLACRPIEKRRSVVTIDTSPAPQGI